MAQLMTEKNKFDGFRPTSFYRLISVNELQTAKKHAQRLQKAIQESLPEAEESTILLEAEAYITQLQQKYFTHPLGHSSQLLAKLSDDIKFPAFLLALTLDGLGYIDTNMAIILVSPMLFSALYAVTGYGYNFIKNNLSTLLNAATLATGIATPEPQNIPNLNNIAEHFLNPSLNALTTFNFFKNSLAGILNSKSEPRVELDLYPLLNLSTQGMNTTDLLDLYKAIYSATLLEVSETNRMKLD